MNPKRSVANPPTINMFHQLPEALVMDILSRLSVKNLFNCKSVCKSWQYIISDAQFAQLQLPRSPTSILIQTRPRQPSSCKFYFTHIECAGSGFRDEKIKLTFENNIPLRISQFRLMNSCSGLLCLRGSYDLLHVCNPILGEFITIPPPKGRVRGIFVGLGFSSGTNEYKVLQTFEPLDLDKSRICVNFEYEAFIYTIGTGAWRSIGTAPNDFYVEPPFDSYVHGALHWVTRSSDDSEFIQSFNFETEQFRFVPPPSHVPPTNKKYVTVGLLGGCLLLCVVGNDFTTFDMWVMKDYGVQESWTKTLVIGNLHPSCHLYEPIMFLSNGKILMSYYHRAVVCYTQHIMRLRKTRITRTKSRLQAIAYTPCFVSLYNFSQVEKVQRVRDGNKSDK